MGSIDADLEVEVAPGRLPGGSSLLVEAPLGGALTRLREICRLKRARRDPGCRGPGQVPTPSEVRADPGVAGLSG